MFVGHLISQTKVSMGKNLPVPDILRGTRSACEQKLHDLGARFRVFLILMSGQDQIIQIRAESRIFQDPLLGGFAGTFNRGKIDIIAFFAKSRLGEKETCILIGFIGRRLAVKLEVRLQLFDGLADIGHLLGVCHILHLQANVIDDRQILVHALDVLRGEQIDAGRDIENLQQRGDRHPGILVRQHQVALVEIQLGLIETVARFADFQQFIQQFNRLRSVARGRIRVLLELLETVSDFLGMLLFYRGRPSLLLSAHFQ